MKILYFGTYDKKEGYPRNRLLLEGLRREGVEVMECHRELWNGNRDKLKELKKFSPLLILRIARTYASLLWRYLHCTGYDIMVVGYPGQLDIHLARILNLSGKSPFFWMPFFPSIRPLWRIGSFFPGEPFGHGFLRPSIAGRAERLSGSFWMTAFLRTSS